MLLGLALPVLLSLAEWPARAQMISLNFDAPNQYYTNFYNASAANGSPFLESTTNGLPDGPGAIYPWNNGCGIFTNNVSFDFSTNTAGLALSAMIFIGQQPSSTSPHFCLGFGSLPNVGLSGNGGSGENYADYRFGPTSTATPTYKLTSEVAVNGNTSTADLPVTPTLTPGHWYKFATYFTNTAPGTSFSMWCTLVDFGTNGATPGGDTLTNSSYPASTIRMTTGSYASFSTNNAVYACLRDQLSGAANGGTLGITAVDNFYAAYLNYVAPPPPGQPPAIASQPASLSLYPTATAQFWVAASSSTPMFYQWQAQPTGAGPFVDLTDGGIISGSATTALTLSGISATNAGNYQVIITNSSGAVTSRVASLAVLVAGAVTNSQLPLASVHYFNGYTGPTNWNVGGTAIYQGNGATVRNDNGGVPVEIIGQVPALVLDSVCPPGGAYWNVAFKVSSTSLNYLRVSTNPAIHLRLLWSAIPSNGAWGLNVSIGNVQLPLGNYLAAPSTNAWQDVYIPASDFRAVNPQLDLTAIFTISLLGVGSHLDHSIVNIAAMDLVPSASQRTYQEFIKVNQVGYASLMRSKLAVVSSEPGTLAGAPTWFQVVNVTNSQVVFTGQLTPWLVQSNAPNGADWPQDGDVIYLGDFGALQTPGTYRVETPELGARSQNFAISANVYQNLFRDALRFFYYSREAQGITNPFAEGYTRVALHASNTNAGYNYDPNHGHYNFGLNTTRDVHGCWADAGDTHSDVPETALACWFLLEADRDFGANLAPGGLDLPESTAGQSDLVPLICWGTDWLKRMQNADGSVQHYVRGEPDDAIDPQQVSDISSFAAACAAGTFAKAYALLNGVVSTNESADLLARAQLSWSWLQANPNMVQPRLPLINGVDPGADDPFWGDVYFDARCRAFAAVELFEATGQAQYNNFFVNQFNQNGASPLRGPVFGTNVTGYADDNVMGYLMCTLNCAFMDYARGSGASDPATQSILKSAWLHQASLLTNYTSLSGYRIPMLSPGHLYWGSSGAVLAPAAMVLARAFQWTGDINFHEAAVQSLHFVCGRNPVNRCFISGYGNDYQHSCDFYSQFWTNFLSQPPGYVGGNIDVGGEAEPLEPYPWKRYYPTHDADMAEPAVSWDSAFAWLAGYAANDAKLPSLFVSPGAPNFSVSWPLRSLPYALDGSTNLNSGAGWTPVTNLPTLSNGLWSLLLPMNSPSRQSYYRLSSP